MAKGNFTTGYQRKNARYDKIWDAYEKQQKEKRIKERIKFLRGNGCMLLADEMEKELNKL